MIYFAGERWARSPTGAGAIVKPADSLRLAFVGDICLGMGWPERLRVHGAGHPFAHVRDLLRDADLTVGNLECCFVDESCPVESRRHKMSVPAEYAEGLAASGFSGLNLANNHMLDCGAEGLAATARALEAVGISHFGAGSDLGAAIRNATLEHDGRRVALLGVGDTSRYYAGRDRPGIAPMRRALLAEGLHEAASDADLVVVSLHADLEFSPVPAAWRRRLSRWLIRQGADLVIQHHPHVLQGIEEYRGGLIAYSLGNFVFDISGSSYQRRRPGVFDSIVLRVDASFEGDRPSLSWHAVPLRIGNDGRPDRLDGAAGRAALERLQQLSSWVRDAGRARRAWRRRCIREVVGNGRGIYYTTRRDGVGPGFRRLRRLLSTSEDWRWLFGLMTLGFR